MAQPATTIDSPSLHGAATETSSAAVKAWRRVVNKARDYGRVAITSHGEVDVVLLSLRELERVEGEIQTLRARVKALQEELSPVNALRENFLARMRERDPEQMNAALRAASANPVRLRGRLKPGERY